MNTSHQQKGRHIDSSAWSPHDCDHKFLKYSLGGEMKNPIPHCCLDGRSLWLEINQPHFVLITLPELLRHLTSQNIGQEQINSQSLN